MAPTEIAPPPSRMAAASGAAEARDSTQRWLIDADAHLDPPYEMRKEYLPSHLHEFAPYIIPRPHSLSHARSSRATSRESLKLKFAALQGSGRAGSIRSDDRMAFDRASSI